MLETLSLTRMAEALADHAAARMDQIARNVAHADSPDYKAMDLPDFAQVYDAGPQSGMRATRAGHITTPLRAAQTIAQPDAGEASPNGNTVSLERELVKSAAVRQEHDMALAVYSHARDILRASLGRK
jgi:flagellar basal-body rod protein FlgB